MIVQVGKVKIEFKTTAHANHCVGAIITQPNGKKSYEEYKSFEEAMNYASALSKRIGLTSDNGE